jgi:phage tail-like protein
MAAVAGTQSRTDPYRNFLFRIQIGGAYVAGVSQVSGLSRSVTPVKYRVGGDPNTHVAPGSVDWPAITLSRGLTTDTAFQQWANTCWSYQQANGQTGSTAPVSLKDFRQTIIIEVYDVSGQKVLTYTVYNCWVSNWSALSELDANDNSLAIESMTIQNEGWELQFNGSSS